MEFILALTLAAAGMPIVGPTGVELERLIDTGAQLPGTTERWVFDGSPPVPCGDGVLFRAVEDIQPIKTWAYYVSPERVEVALDEETFVPDTGFRFESIGDIRCLETNRFALLGSGEPAANLPSSAFEWLPGGQLSLIQRGGVSIGGRDFGSLIDLGGNGCAVGILGRLESFFSGEALFVKPFDRDPILVADMQEILPGQSMPLTGFSSEPLMQGSSLVFRAVTFPDAGLYRWTEGQGISLLVDGQTPVPGYPGTFAGAGFFTVLSDGVAFSAGFSGGLGIFLYDESGNITALVSPGQVTEGGETIETAHSPRGAGNLFSFSGTTLEMPQESLFAWLPGGEVVRILGVGEAIDGRNVIGINGSADSRSVALIVDTFDTEHRSTLYRATFVNPPVAEIPTLSAKSAALLAILMGLAGLWGLRRLG